MSQQINLLNPDLLTKQEWLDARMMVLLTGAAALLLLVVMGWTDYRATQLAREQQAVSAELATLKQQLDQSMLRHAPRPPSKALLEDLAMAEAALKNRQQLLAFLQGGGFGNPHGFSDYMEAFARQGMKGLWLTGFSIDDSVSLIKISGRALRPEMVPQYISGLRQEPMLKGREFSALEMGSVASAPVVPGAAGAAAVPEFVEFKLQSLEKKADAGHAPASGGAVR